LNRPGAASSALTKAIRAGPRKTAQATYVRDRETHLAPYELKHEVRVSRQEPGAQNAGEEQRKGRLSV